MIWIILAIVVILILYIWLKPYFIHWNNTICLTGEMGVGKTNIAVNKVTIPVYKGRLLRVKLHNWFIKQINKIIEHHNRKTIIKAKNPKFKGKTWSKKEYIKPPRVLSNIPICLKWSKHEEKQVWSNILEKEMLTFEKLRGELIKLPENSVLLLDELPQLVNQFNWDIPEVQDNLNEFVTFIRHYFNGTLVVTAQSVGQVVKPLREKMNTFYWLENIHKYFGKFYSVDVVQFMSTELVTNFTEGFVEDNTKKVYGIFHKHRYDSRCYSPRYEDLPENKEYKFKRWHDFKTKRIIRFGKYISPLDKQKKEK